MGNVAARSHRLFPGREILVPLVPSTVVILPSVGSGLCCRSPFYSEVTSVLLKAADDPAMKQCVSVLWGNTALRVLPCFQWGTMSRLFMVIKGPRCTFWNVRLLIPVCWPKSIFSDATLAISISSVVPDGDNVGDCILFQTACWAPLSFGTADIFQKQPCCSGVWSDLYISLTCLTAKEWGLINYDQIVIPVKSKEGLFFHWRCGGQGWLLCGYHHFEIPAHKTKWQYKALPCWRCLCTENSFSWRGKCSLKVLWCWLIGPCGFACPVHSKHAWLHVRFSQCSSWCEIVSQKPCSWKHQQFSFKHSKKVE